MEEVCHYKDRERNPYVGRTCRGDEWKKIDEIAL